MRGMLRRTPWCVFVLVAASQGCAPEPVPAAPPSPTDAGAEDATREDRFVAPDVEPADVSAPKDTPPPTLDAPTLDAPPTLDVLTPRDTGSATDAPVPPRDGASMGTPARGLDRVHLHLNLGDSVGAGYNATARDTLGYSALFYRNASAYPAYARHDLVTLYPNARRIDRARSGWQTGDVADDLRGAIGSLPAGGDGDDTVVTVSAGGNDFNDNVRTIIDPTATATVATRAAGNVAEVMRLLRGRYHDPARGRFLIVLWTNVHDPTDGTGRVPATFTRGFCATLQNPLFTDALRRVALDNLARFNMALGGAITAQGAFLVDSHRVFTGHGMNAAGASRWIDTDCVHPVNEGHHQLRREVFRVFTGELY